MKKKKITYGVLIFIIIGIVTYSYCYLTDGQKYDDDLYWVKNTNFAHRGLYDNLSPQNSVKAVKKAMKYNYGVEIDVRLTKDKKVIVIHDENLKNMTSVDKDVSEVNYSEIKDLTLLDTNENIPLLSEVLEAVDSKIPIIIEIKDCENVLELSKEVNDIVKNYMGQFVIASFNPFVLEYFKLNSPQTVRAQLVCNYYTNEDAKHLAFYEKFVLHNMLLNFKSKPNVIMCELDELPKLRAQQLKDKDIILLSYTIKDNEELEKAYKYSDNVIFENFLIE